jgi:uncharacterized PurR-regulated membrane protein YhhQ (DUF165 family)
MHRFTSAGLVALLLSTIVAANLSSAHFGPSASIYNAFLLVGVFLSTKDYLYDVWREHRVRNMAALIVAGSIVSYVATFLFAGDGVPHDVVAKIALGSFAAFAVGETWDTLVYARLRGQAWLMRSNTSNLVGAALDSAIFVSIAFGWSWPIVFGQFCAKVAGGYVWSLVIEWRRTDERDVAVATS